MSKRTRIQVAWLKATAHTTEPPTSSTRTSWQGLLISQFENWLQRAIWDWNCLNGPRLITLDEINWSRLSKTIVDSDLAYSVTRWFDQKFAKSIKKLPKFEPNLACTKQRGGFTSFLSFGRIYWQKLHNHFESDQILLINKKKINWAKNFSNWVRNFPQNLFKNEVFIFSVGQKLLLFYKSWILPFTEKSPKIAL